MNDTQLDKNIRSLPEEIRPPRDLWPAIEQALDNPASHVESTAKSGAFDYRARIAAAILLVATGVLLLNRPDDNRNEMTFETMSGLLDRQKQSLLVDYRQIPALTGNWMEQLEELEAAAETIKSALKNNPDNGVLLGMLKQVYMQQLDLIQTVHQPKYQNI